MDKETSEKQLVLMNEEEQYSLWPENKAIPLGWKQVFDPEQKDVCLEYVRKVWVDMRPKSLREAMKK